MIVNRSNLLPYQACLMPNLPEDFQLKMRDVANHFVIPLNMLIAFVAFVCNGLVVYTVVGTRSLHQPPMLMLCSLAVTDLIYPVYNLYRQIEILAHEHMCPANASTESASLSALCLLATLANLAVISRDRYLAVRKTLWYHFHVTNLRALKMICLAWSLSAAITFIMYLSRKFPGRFSPVGPVASLLFYLICFFVIIFSYLGIFCKKISREQLALNMRAILEREKRSANTVGLILLALLLTFLPGLLCPLVLNAKGLVFQPFRPFYGFFLQLNGFLNPLLNFGRSKDMRKALRRKLFMKCGSQDVRPFEAISKNVRVIATNSQQSVS